MCNQSQFIHCKYHLIDNLLVILNNVIGLMDETNEHHPVHNKGIIPNAIFCSTEIQIQFLVG